MNIILKKLFHKRKRRKQRVSLTNVLWIFGALLAFVPLLLHRTVYLRLPEEIKEKAAERIYETVIQNGAEEQLFQQELFPAKLLRVVDGDTLVVDFDGEERKVRLIGVDAPESVNPDETKNTTEGKLASEFMNNLLENTENVYLQLGKEKEDQYGRLLAYVWLTDDIDILTEECIRTKMLEGILLANGMAEVMNVEPNTDYGEIFTIIRNNFKEKRGEAP